jgi:GTPase SAR1 family protein
MILLLGGVGAGKTTFLHRFFRIILKDKPNFFWFYVNFGKAPIDASKIEEFIYQKIIEQF